MRRVAGSGTQSTVLMDIAVGAGPFYFLHVCARACIRDPAGRFRVLMLAGDHAAFLALTAGRDGSGRSLLRAGGCASIGRDVALTGGYDLVTGEVSGGVSIAAGPAAAFSWAMHPVLGTTFSASVGVVR
jgi:hypothetical protein